MSQAARWQHGVNIKDLETSVMIVEKVWKDPLFITDDSSFVCVCNSVSYSSLGSEKYQISLVFVPKLERAAEEPHPHSA